MGMLDKVKFTHKDKTYSLIKELESRVEEISFRTINVIGNPHEPIASFILNEYLPSQMEVITIDDYENIYNSCEDNMAEPFKNNGIIYEWIVDNILADKYDLTSLLVIEDLNLQTPEQGIDMIYIDKDYKNIFLFEAKSSESRMTIDSYVKLINNGLNSLFCRPFMRSNAKISRSKKALRGKDISPDSKRKALDVMSDLVRNRRNLLNLLDNESININVVTLNTVVEGFQDEEMNIKFQEEFVKVFTSTYKCKSDCSLKGRDPDHCKEVLERQKVINLFTIQFTVPISIQDIYSNIRRLIENGGFLNE